MRAQRMQAQSLEEAFKQICAMEAPLHERLEAFSAAVRKFGLPFADAYDDLVQRIRSGDAGHTAPKVGERMPSFLLPDESGRLLDLRDLLADGPAVISFNRGHWCEYCAIELTALSDALSEIAAHGGSVTSIMPETEEFTKKAAERTGNAFRILSDIDHGYALSLGLVVWLGERVRKLYLQHGLDLPRFQNSSSWFVPIPATFVVARDGHIVARYVDPDFRKRMDVEEIVAALKSCGT
jgi:peroxiredoxin